MYNVTSRTNDRSVKNLVFQEGTFALFQFKFKAVVAIKGFAEVLKPGVEIKLSDKENDIVSDSDDSKNKLKMKPRMLLLSTI